MAPTISEFDEILYTRRVCDADYENINYFEIGPGVQKLWAFKNWPSASLGGHFESHM